MVEIRFDYDDILFVDWYTSDLGCPQILIGSIWFYFLENDKFWIKMDCIFWC